MATKIVGLIRKKMLSGRMLTPEHSRAARGWLDWSQEELARRANVSLSTVRDFEKGRRIPISNNLAAIARVFESVGIIPLDDQGRPAGIGVETPGRLRITEAGLGKTPGTDDHA